MARQKSSKRKGSKAKAKGAASSSSAQPNKKARRHLGWEAALTFHDVDGRDRIPLKAILGWMATLEKEDGDNPPRTTTFTGKVGETKVVMSFDTIRQVAAFDSKPDDEYVFPPLRTMFETKPSGPEGIALVQLLFKAGASGELFRRDLNIMPKWLSVIAGHNVIPRMGEKMKVRHYELRVLQALFTGEEMLSFRHLVMLNVWESRDSYDRKMIPHCRLITTLMRLQGALDDDNRFETKQHKLLVWDKLSKQDWQPSTTERFYVLKDKKTKQVLRGLKPNAPPLQGDEAEEHVESSSEEEEEEEDEDEVERPRAGATGQRFDHRNDGTCGEDWLHYEDKAMKVVVKSKRLNGFESWPHLTQLVWDRMSQENELARRHRERVEDQQKQLARDMLEAQEK